MGDIPLLLGILDEFVQHDLVLGSQSVRPRIFAENFFLFFKDQDRARKRRALGIVIGFPADPFRFSKRIQEA